MADQVIAGRYRIEGRLGIGGMSTVQLAPSTRGSSATSPSSCWPSTSPRTTTFVSRFRREALAAARLVHPNIVQVFDFGLDERTGQHYIVMELRRRPVVRRDPARPRPPRRRRGARHHRPGLPRPRLRPPQRRRAPRRQARQPAALPRRASSSSPTSGSPRRPSSRRSPRSARCWAPPPTWRPSRRAARRPARRGPLRARRRRLPAAVRPPALRGDVADRAGAQAAARGAGAAGLGQPPRCRPALARAVDRALALDPARPLRQRRGDGEALRDGARGVEPPEATDPTETAATRVVGGERPARPARRHADAGADEHPAARQPRQARRPTRPSHRRPASAHRRAGRTARSPRAQRLPQVRRRAAGPGCSLIGG